MGLFEPFEKAAYDRGFSGVVGVDEVGRGPLAGPVVAAACFVDRAVFTGERAGWTARVNDSKKLSEAVRNAIFDEAVKSPFVRYGVGFASADEIDEINILQASLLAMNRAIDALILTGVGVDYLLIDGNRGPKNELQQQMVVKGDARCFSIALASVIAKVLRDAEMDRWHQKRPEYGFNRHKGYGTRLHLDALGEHGILSGFHRRSFAPIYALDSR